MGMISVLWEVPHFIRDDIHKTIKPCAVARMADIASIGPSLPSAALPASGSRGLQPFARLSAIAAPPQFRFLLGIGLVLGKSITRSRRHVACEQQCSRHGCH